MFFGNPLPRRLSLPPLLSPSPFLINLNIEQRNWRSGLAISMIIPLVRQLGATGGGIDWRIQRFFPSIRFQTGGCLTPDRSSWFPPSLKLGFMRKSPPLGLIKRRLEKKRKALENRGNRTRGEKLNTGYPRKDEISPKGFWFS